MFFYLGYHGVDGQFLYAVPVIGSSTSQSWVKKWATAPCVTTMTYRAAVSMILKLELSLSEPLLQVAETASSENLQRASISLASHRPNSLAARHVSQRLHAAKRRLLWSSILFSQQKHQSSPDQRSARLLQTDPVEAFSDLLRCLRFPYRFQCHQSLAALEEE